MKLATLGRELQERRTQQRGYARGQRLLPKWRKLRKQLGV